MASTKDRILDAALIEFGEQGYFKTTMDHLAEKAGVAKGTLYWNFKNKESLLLDHSFHFRHYFMANSAYLIV